MNPRCRQQLNAARIAAGGKPLTDAQAAAIEARLKRTASVLAQRDPGAWHSLPADQRTLKAAQQAAQDISFEAARKMLNAEQQVIRTAEVEMRLQQQMQRLSLTRAQAWADDIQQTSNYITGIKKDYARRLIDAIDASESTAGVSPGRWLAMKALGADNPQMTAAIAAEIHARGKAGTGNEIARKAAVAWLDTAEEMRTRANAAGFDIGRLEYGYMPTMWEPELVLKAGPAKFAERVMPLLDRKRYVREDGTRMDDGEVLAFLRAAGETIQSDGANKAQPGQFRGSGARANRGADHRQIHFKDGEAYIAAMQEYGSGSMYEAMTSHLGLMARDIGLVERFGPNAEAQHRLQVDLAGRSNPSGQPGLAAWSGLDHHWSVVSGVQTAQWRYTPPVIGIEFTGGGAARFGQHVRNLEVSGKLGATLLSSITDLPTYFATTHYNKLPYFDSFLNIPRSMTPVARAELVDFMSTHGMIADTLIDNLNRFSGENVAPSWSARLSSKTMHLGLVNWFTDGLRRAYALTMMKGLAKTTRTPWAELDEWTREILLARRGITEGDWQALQGTALLSTKWGDLLTPEAIYASGHPDAAQVASKYLGLLASESQFASIEPDVAARAFLRRGTTPGTVPGEFARYVGQFKAFPVAMFTRHWRRVMETPGGLEGAPLGFQSETPVDRLAFLGGLVVSLTGLGAVSLQSREIKEGRDPINMTTSKFWVRALAQGGGLGFLGDVLLRDTSDDLSPKQGLFELIGPAAGSGAQLFELTKGNLDEYLAGKKTHAGAEALQFARGHAPFVNLFYAKAALDNAGMHALQENLSPGYLSRIQARARRSWGNEYWWKPGGDFLPERAPNLSFEQLAGAAR